MEPIDVLVRPIDVTDSDDEMTDNGDDVRLPGWVEDYFARERRGGGSFGRRGRYRQRSFRGA